MPADKTTNTAITIDDVVAEVKKRFPGAKVTQSMGLGARSFHADFRVGEYHVRIIMVGKRGDDREVSTRFMQVTKGPKDSVSKRIIRESTSTDPAVIYGELDRIASYLQGVLFDLQIAFNEVPVNTRSKFSDFR